MTEQDAPPTQALALPEGLYPPVQRRLRRTALFSVGNAVLDVGMIWYLGRWST
jgi:ATP-binding cassette, subfamily B, multidrug efflux pump